jgi:NAD-dependent DNA ligase
MKRITEAHNTVIDTTASASKALGVLKGLIEGVSCDQHLNDFERASITGWVDEFLFLKSDRVMSEVFDKLAVALSDGILTLEEVADLKWTIERNLISFHGDTAQKIQYLHGLLSGIAADNEINAAEYVHIWEWLNNNEELKGLFPYDEIYSVVFQIGTKRQMTALEHSFLVSAFRWSDQEHALTLCPFVPWEVDPDIRFNDKTFCWVGNSNRLTLKHLINEIQTRKARYSESVSLEVDYLVVADSANKAWAQSIHGRKIEMALKNRKNGHSIALICESDFWEALKNS